MSKKYLETIKVVDGVALHLEYHQLRLNTALDMDTTAPSHNLKKILFAPSVGTYRCRIVYDTQSIDIEYIKYEKREIKSLKIVYSDDVEYAKKYADRENINELFLLKDICDDILIVKSGLITETSIANVAFYDGKEWLTPLKPLLKGTTRARYLKEGKIREENIFVDDLKKFTKLALLNAMIDFDIIAEENIGGIIC